MFEGIATLTLDGVEHDTYMTVHLETVGYIARWLGTFGWMGEAPKGVFHGEEVDILLSDGREGRIKIPHPAGEDGKVEFLGLGSPPGFTWIQAETVEAELVSTTPTWHVWASRAFATLSTLLVFASIWVDDYRWQSILSGVLAMLLAIGFMPTHRKPLPEVPSDCPHQ